jgi:hypothetical protein
MMMMIMMEQTMVTSSIEVKCFWFNGDNQYDYLSSMLLLVLLLSFTTLATAASFCCPNRIVSRTENGSSLFTCVVALGECAESTRLHIT